MYSEINPLTKSAVTISSVISVLIWNDPMRSFCVVGGEGHERCPRGWPTGSLEEAKLISVTVGLPLSSFGTAGCTSPDDITGRY